MSLLNNIFGAGSIDHEELTAWFLVASGWGISFLFLIWKLNHTRTSNLDKPMPVTRTQIFTSVNASTAKSILLSFLDNNVAKLM